MRDDRSNLPHQGDKLKYERPQLTRIGSLETITRHAAGGTNFDKDFAAGDPCCGAFSDFPTKT
jgi:hypothetical protein